MSNNNESNKFENSFENNIDELKATFSSDLKKTTSLFSETVQSDISLSDEANKTDSIFGEDFEDANELFATMGLQMEYTESLAEKHDNRSIETVKFIDVEDDKIKEITQSLIKEYGEESKQVQKWLEQLRKIEMYKDLQRRAIKQKKMQTTIAGILIAFGVLLIAGCIFMLSNSTNYYVNLGDYSHIYKKTILGAPEKISDVSALTIQKQGFDIYYIDKSNSGLYKLNLKTEESELITSSETAYFVATSNSIFYINKSQGNKLYWISTESGESKEIINNECSELTLKRKELQVKVATGGTYTVNTKTGDVIDN